MDDRTRLWNDRGLLRRAEELLAGTIPDRSRGSAENRPHGVRCWRT